MVNVAGGPEALPSCSAAAAAAGRASSPQGPVFASLSDSWGEGVSHPEPEHRAPQLQAESSSHSAAGSVSDDDLGCVSPSFAPQLLAGSCIAVRPPVADGLDPFFCLLVTCFCLPVACLLAVVDFFCNKAKALACRSWGMEGAEEFGEFEVNVGGMLVPEHEQAWRSCPADGACEEPSLGCSWLKHSSRLFTPGQSC
eukprot:scaffold75024_cov21-Tisochrysis_lutea.AAC.2